MDGRRRGHDRGGGSDAMFEKGEGMPFAKAEVNFRRQRQAPTMARSEAL